MPHPGLLHPEPLPLQQSTADSYLHRRHSNPVLFRSPEACSLSVFVNKMASPVMQRLNHLPAMWETWVRSLGQEDPQRRKWQPTPVFLPGESHGRRSLVGYSPRVAKSQTRLSDFTFTFFLVQTARGVDHAIDLHLFSDCE